MAIIVIVMLALIAANMLILLVTGWILAYAGVFYLGFGGSRWTSDIAISYFKTVLNVAIQLMSMILLVGIGQQFINAYYAQIGANINLNDMAAMLVAAIVLLVLVNKIPPLIGSIAQGGDTKALGGEFGAGSVIAAAGAAGAAAAKLASQDALSSADLVSRMGGIVNGAFDSGASSNTSAASTISALAAAMGYTFASQFTGTRNIGRQSGSTVSHLASGFNQVVGDKILTRINQSIGGQIASAINQSSGTQALSNKGTRQVFDNNSLSGEQASTDDSRADEIAAFRDG